MNTYFIKRLATNFGIVGLMLLGWLGFYQLGEYFFGDGIWGVLVGLVGYFLYLTVDISWSQSKSDELSAKNKDFLGQII